MIRFIARRLATTVITLVGILMLTFFLSRVMPGDPARLLAGPRASAELVERVRELNGLDQPIWVQFSAYVQRIATGDLGTSIVTRRPVLDDIAQYFPATLELVLVTFVLACVVGIGTGLVAGINAGNAIDMTGRGMAIGGLSLPDFWVAILAQLLFYSTLGWLPFGGRLPTGWTPPEPVTGFYTVDALIGGNPGLAGTAFVHLVLPASVLALAAAGLIARIVRASILEVLSQDYVRFARAKGISATRLYLRHVLSNALLPVVTFLGLLLGLLLSGAVLVELVFAWPGIGRYTANAVSSSDYNAIMGVTLVVAGGYVLINFLVDLLYLRLDPRVTAS